MLSAIPIIPSPTTHIPITAPPENATFRAAAIHLTLLLLEQFLRLPLLQHSFRYILQELRIITPTTNTRAVVGLIKIPRIIATTTTKIARDLYSLDKKAAKLRHEYDQLVLSSCHLR